MRFARLWRYPLAWVGLAAVVVAPWPIYRWMENPYGYDGTYKADINIFDILGTTGGLDGYTAGLRTCQQLSSDLSKAGGASQLARSHYWHLIAASPAMEPAVENLQGLLGDDLATSTTVSLEQARLGEQKQQGAALDFVRGVGCVGIHFAAAGKLDEARPYIEALTRAPRGDRILIEPMALTEVACTAFAAMGNAAQTPETCHAVAEALGKLDQAIDTARLTPGEVAAVTMMAQSRIWDPLIERRDWSPDVLMKFETLRYWFAYRAIEWLGASSSAAGWERMGVENDVVVSWLDPAVFTEWSGASGYVPYQFSNRPLSTRRMWRTRIAAELRKHPKELRAPLMPLAAAGWDEVTAASFMYGGASVMPATNLAAGITKWVTVGNAPRDMRTRIRVARAAVIARKKFMVSGEWPENPKEIGLDADEVTTGPGPTGEGVLGQMLGMAIDPYSPCSVTVEDTVGLGRANEQSLGIWGEPDLNGDASRLSLAGTDAEEKFHSAMRLQRLLGKGFIDARLVGRGISEDLPVVDARTTSVQAQAAVLAKWREATGGQFSMCGVEVRAVLPEKILVVRSAGADGEFGWPKNRTEDFWQQRRDSGGSPLPPSMGFDVEMVVLPPPQ